MLTPGFLSKNLLWKMPSRAASIVDLNARYKGVRFTLF